MYRYKNNISVFTIYYVWYIHSMYLYNIQKDYTEVAVLLFYATDFCEFCDLDRT